MRILIPENAIQQRIDQLAQEITHSHPSKTPLTVVGVLTGALIFVADLVRRLPMRLRIDLMRASSYRGPVTDPGELHVETDLLPDIAGRHVLLLDDILDSGRTLRRLYDSLKAHQPESLKTGVLLRKTGRQVVAMEPDFVGFTIPDEFVVGYGLDFNDEYRHLPYIGVWEGEHLS